MPMSVLAGSLTVDWFCLALIQFVTGSPRYADYLRKPLWGRVTLVVLVLLFPAVASAFNFVVLLTSPYVDTVSPLLGWGVIAIVAAAIITSLILELRYAQRSRHSHPTPLSPSPEPDHPV